MWPELSPMAEQYTGYVSPIVSHDHGEISGQAIGTYK